MVQLARRAAVVGLAPRASRDTPLVIAHRGASAIAPENTLLAFRLAIEAGAEMIETDVRLSGDGELVLIHDDDLARTTDCAGLVSEMSLAEIEACDAGYWFTANGSGTYPFRGLKIGVPRLDALFALVETVNPDVRLNLEIKAADRPGEMGGRRTAERLVELLARHGQSERVLVSSFDPSAIDAVRRIAPEVATGYLADDDADLYEAIGVAVERGHTTLHPCHRALGPPEHGAAVVAAAHEAGLSVNVWTVNDPARMIELAAMGVDGIFSDDPERLRRTLASG